MNVAELRDWLTTLLVDGVREIDVTSRQPDRARGHILFHDGTEAVVEIRRVES